MIDDTLYMGIVQDTLHMGIIASSIVSCSNIYNSHVQSVLYHILLCCMILWEMRWFPCAKCLLSFDISKVDCNNTKKGVLYCSVILYNTRWYVLYLTILYNICCTLQYMCDMIIHMCDMITILYNIRCTLQSCHTYCWYVWRDHSYVWHDHSYVWHDYTIQYAFISLSILWYI